MANVAIGRIVYHLVHTNEDLRWHLKRDGKSIEDFATKEEGLSAGEAFGQAHWGKGDRAQLVVHRQDGSIEKEYTYGKDPRKTRG